MKIYFPILFLLTYSYKVYTQDTIIFIDNQKRVTAKILEVLPEEIKYKKFANQDGPTFTVKKTDIEKVIYSDGEIEKFGLNLKVETPKKETMFTKYFGDNVVSQKILKLKNNNYCIVYKTSPADLLFMQGQHLYLLLIDNNGNRLLNTEIKTDDCKNENIDGIMETEDGIVILSNKISVSSYLSLCYRKIDYSGNLLIEKKYKYSDDYASYSVVNGPNGGFIFTIAVNMLYISRKDKIVPSYLVFLDRNGGKLKEIPAPKYLYFTNTLCADSNSFFITGFKKDSIKKKNFHSFVIKIDTTGKIKKEYVSSNNTSSFFPRTIKRLDQNLIICGDEKQEKTENIFFSILNQDLELIKNKSVPLGKSKGENLATLVCQNSGITIIAHELEKFLGYMYWNGIIYRFDLQGNEIIKNSVYDPNRVTHITITMNDAVLNNDGSLLFICKTDWYPDVTNQKTPTAFFVKTNANCGYIPFNLQFKQLDPAVVLQTVSEVSSAVDQSKQANLASVNNQSSNHQSANKVNTSGSVPPSQITPYTPEKSNYGGVCFNILAYCGGNSISGPLRVHVTPGDYYFEASSQSCSGCKKNLVPGVYYYTTDFTCKGSNYAGGSQNNNPDGFNWSGSFIIEANQCKTIVLTK